MKILDPATGTGTFLVEVIDLIHHRMTEDVWKDESPEHRQRLWSAYVAKHLLPRLYGYELMMAPYAVAHMKIGLKLAETGYDFSGVEAGLAGSTRPLRARVFLTNALEPAQDLDMQLAFMNEALAHEAKAANDTKVRTHFTAIVGNPPYSNFGKSNKNHWIHKLLEGFRGESRGRAKINLYDDYIKFFGLSLHLVKCSGAGVLGLITNRSFLDGATQSGMRRVLTDGASVSILDLYRGVHDPDAYRDENVFDIQTGVSILLRWTETPKKSVKFSRLIGKFNYKVSILSNSIITIQGWKSIKPCAPHYFLIDNSRSGEVYSKFSRITEFFFESTTGVQTNRDELCIANDSKDLVARMERFSSSPKEARAVCEENAISDSDFWNHESSSVVLNQKGISEEKVRPYLYRIFDYRFIYYDDSVVHRPRELVDRAILGRSTISLLTSRGVDAPGRGVAFVTTQAADKRALKSARGEAKIFPSRVPGLNSDTNFKSEQLGVGDVRIEDGISYIYAILNSPNYTSQFEAELRLDYPRIPQPNDRELFNALVPLGNKLINLHLLDAKALPNLLEDPRVRFSSNGGQPRLGRYNKDVHRDASGRVYVNETNWFATVSQAAWEQWVGGYQPAQKWLNDRSQTGSKDKIKPGRLLSDEDMLHYRRVIVALEETGRVMAEIDTVIDKHGGWPDAFRMT
ncbi:MAG: hypothetical protein F9K30_23820 [Dechloromonas sp.]|nr:MAG: hypothetical protein F9K30_23820 [Dechloromonas sp.]